MSFDDGMGLLRKGSAFEGAPFPELMPTNLGGWSYDHITVSSTFSRQYGEESGRRGRNNIRARVHRASDFRRKTSLHCLLEVFVYLQKACYSVFYQRRVMSLSISQNLPASLVNTRIRGHIDRNKDRHRHATQRHARTPPTKSGNSIC